MAQQGTPPPRSGRIPAAARRRGPGEPWKTGPWGADHASGDDAPWQARQESRQHGEERPPGQEPPGRGDLGADPEPGPDPGRRQGFRSRLGAARARRARLKLYIWAAAGVAVAVIVAVVLVGLGGHEHKPAAVPGLVTTYQPGELKTVPRACSSVTATTLTQSMQGQPARIAPQPLDGAAQSICDWTVDAPPVYRHLEVTLQAAAPSGLASGDGSATNAAKDAYQKALQQKVKPPKRSGLPRADISRPGHLGTQAFLALQRVASGSSLTDIETLVARVHNVLVTVVLQGTQTGRYGPVPVTRLAAGAVAVAREVLSRLP